MVDRDPLDDILGQPDRPIAPSLDFGRRLRAQVLAELAPDQRSGGDTPSMMHRAISFAPTSVPSSSTGRSRSARQPRWLFALEAAAVALLALGTLAALLNARGGPTPNRDRNYVAASLAATPDTAAMPAAMSGGDAARSGTQPGPGPADDVAPRWHIDPNTQFVFGTSPVALGDRVYQVHQENSTSGTNTFLDALDLGTGQRLWRQTLPVFGSPAVTKQLVYVTTMEQQGSGTPTRNLVALDAASGQEAWRSPMGDSIGALASSPIVAGGVVYDADPDGTVYAFDAVSGEVRWTSTAARSNDPRTEARGADEGENLASSGAIALGNGHLYVINPSEQLFALDTAAGTPLWHFTIRDRYVIAPEVITPMAIDGAVILKIRGGDVGARVPVNVVDLIALVEADSGAGLWTKEFADLTGNLAVADRSLIVPVLGAGRVEAWDIASGEQRWGVAKLSRDGLEVSVVGHVAYVAGVDGTLRALDTASGDERWRVDVPQPPVEPSPVGDGSVMAMVLQGPPAVANGSVVVIGPTGALFAYGGGKPVGSPVATP
jgi:outer membrane protein assembly factor BamB